MVSVSPLSLLGLALAGAAAVMIGLWEIQRRRNDATLVDAAWAIIIGTLALIYGAVFPGAPLRRALAATLGGIWGFRLGWHIMKNRVVEPAGEDGRYRAMRAAMGEWAQPGFFIFFQVQAFAAVLFSLPYAAIASDHRTELGVLDVIGLILWVVAIAGETAADRQLERFRREQRKGQACRAGLWRYSRHPNYFFEWLHWCAYVPLTRHTPSLPLTLALQALMLLLLLRFSGVPYAEAQALRSRGDDYRRYQRETSMFIPWFSRSASHSGPVDQRA